MAVTPDWTTGTVTLTSGANTFTVAGMSLTAIGAQPGDSFIRTGRLLVIATIASTTTGTLAENCPADAAGSAVPVRLRFQTDGSRLMAATQTLLNSISSGNLSAFSGLSLIADRLPYANGTGTLALATFTPFARTLLDDTTQALALGTLGVGWALPVTDGSTDVLVLPSGTTALRVGTNDYMRFNDTNNTWYFSGDASSSGLTTGLNSTVKAGTFDLETKALGNASDSVSAPSYTWTGDENTGFWHLAADDLGVTVGGVTMMRVYASGVVVGKTTAATDDTTTGVGIGDTGYVLGTRSAAPAVIANRLTSNGAAIELRRTGATVGTISVTTTATTYNTSSDARLKYGLSKTLEPGDVIEAIADELGTFRWKANDADDYGAYAQTLNGIFPDMVTEGDDTAPWTAAWGSPVVPRLIAYTVSRMRAMEARLAELERM